jgi:hypothetical protein
MTDSCCVNHFMLTPWSWLEVTAETCSRNTREETVRSRCHNKKCILETPNSFLLGYEVQFSWMWLLPTGYGQATSSTCTCQHRKLQAQRQSATSRRTCISRPCVSLRTSRFHKHKPCVVTTEVVMCFMWFPQKGYIIYLHSINLPNFYNRDGVCLLHGTNVNHFSRGNSPQWARVSSLLRLHDHNQTHYTR